MLKLLLRLLCKLAFKITGWKLRGHLPHHLNKFVIIVAPHTSAKDIPLGLAVKSVGHIEYVKYMMKAELFKAPYGWFFRALGGYPVDRSKNNNLVDAIVDIFNSKERFAIAIAPEGTRKRVEKLKSGFYYIAQKAGIPIVMVGFDFPSKTVKFSEAFYPSGNYEKDMQFILKYFSGFTGANPELGITQKHLPAG
ncbi:MAG: 1-acyl-sn-glycerol-3-phosphate acyltransferase [Bacteroidota bacterium]